MCHPFWKLQVFAKTFHCPSTIRTIQFDLKLSRKKKNLAAIFLKLSTSLAQRSYSQNEFIWNSREVNKMEKNKISVFSELNDISHLLDQAFSSSRSSLITVCIWSTLWLEYPSDVNMITNITKHLGILRILKFSLNRSNLDKNVFCLHSPPFWMHINTPIL
jgi:hypothetical protein